VSVNLDALTNERWRTHDVAESVYDHRCFNQPLIPEESRAFLDHDDRRATPSPLSRPAHRPPGSGDCDTSDEWTSIARRYWQRAGVADRIDLRIGPAIETLRVLPAEQRIDIAFIDADKSSYPAYYEEIVSRLRRGGLVVLDNVFLGGRVLDPAYQEEHHQVMRRLNDLITADERMDSVMLPLRDGITIARKR
jgi:hypothetical protein